VHPGWRPLWVVDFPMFEYDEQKKTWGARHHPFTAPKDGHEQLFDADPGNALAKAYDVVLNGWEIGGGSVRIHRPEVQARVFESLGIMFFAFTCQVNVFSIYGELQRPSIRRMNKVVDRAQAISLSIYCLIGVFGYVRYASDTGGNILQNLSISDPMVALAQIAVGLTIVLAYPLSVFPARFTIEMGFFPRHRRSTLRFILITLLIVLPSLALAIYTPGINTVFGLLGSTTSSVVCFILPPMFYLKVMPRAEDAPPSVQVCGAADRALAWALLIAGVVVGVLCTVVSIQAMV